MAIKEFRKILSQKWIIYILLLLCFVNVFLDTRNIDSEIKKAAAQTDLVAAKAGTTDRKNTGV
mgnify:CR=1 FL=1